MIATPNKVGSFDGAPEPYRLVQDRKRDLDYRSKYALGVIVRGDGVDARPNARAIQPVKLAVKHQERKRWHSKTHPKYGVKEKAILTSDSSTDDEPRESPESTAPDADIAYSYDSAFGPTHGSDILSMALNKAVERFETRETEKLVKTEYDVLGSKDYEDTTEGYFGDDDFELV